MRTPVELVYGRSGVGKTTWWLKLAAHIFATTGKKTRCYSGDGGSDTVDNSGLVDDGVVELFQFTTRPHPFETASFVCQGRWPKDVNDPTSPLVDLTPADREKYGFFVYEGLSVLSNYYMNGLARQHAMGPSGGKFAQDTNVSFTDGEVKVGGNPMADYQIAQRELVARIEDTRRLPGIVYWTAHQKDAEDVETKERIVGPDCGGKALTSKIGASFGNTIHIDTASRTKKVKDATTGKEVEVIDLERRAYTREHYDPDAKNFVKYYANNRCFTPEKMPLYLAPPDPIRFYALLKEGRLRAVSA